MDPSDDCISSARFSSISLLEAPPGFALPPKILFYTTTLAHPNPPFILYHSLYFSLFIPLSICVFLYLSISLSSFSLPLSLSYFFLFFISLFSLSLSLSLSPSPPLSSPSLNPLTHWHPILSLHLSIYHARSLSPSLLLSLSPTSTQKASFSLFSTTLAIAHCLPHIEQHHVQKHTEGLTFICPDHDVCGTASVPRFHDLMNGFNSGVF